MKHVAEEVPEAGIGFMPAVEYLEDPPNANLVLKTGDVYAGKDDFFRVMDPSELPVGVQWGCEYRTYCVNVPIYCSYLLSEFLMKGGRTIRRRLRNPTEAFQIAADEHLGHVLTVVNCSGRNFDLDPASKIIRGQTCLVGKQHDKTVTRQNSDGTWVFLIPRPLDGGTIVGGSKDIDDWEPEPRPATTEALLSSTVEAFPDFVKSTADFTILKHNVGRRPWRESGLRLEIEQLNGHRRIVHGYGAGGRGYELSWAVAERLVKLVGTPTFESEHRQI